MTDLELADELYALGISTLPINRNAGAMLVCISAALRDGSLEELAKLAQKFGQERMKFHMGKAMEAMEIKDTN